MKGCAFVALELLVLSSYAIGTDDSLCQTTASRAVPIETVYIYACPNISGASFLQMLVTVPAAGKAPTSPPSDLLTSRGIIWNSSHADTIQFHANVSNNNTVVNCTYMNITSLRTVCGSSVMLAIYDKPQRPQQLQVHIQAASTCKLFFNVTWTPPYTPPGVNVFYTVAVVNWSDVDSSKNITLMRSISSCFVAFPHPANPTSCYPYQFTVLAENAAGVSGYSNPVVANVAIAPWVTGSVQITFSYADGVTLNFKGFQDCSNSSITFYVQFQSITLKRQEIFGPYSSADYNGTVHLKFSTAERLILNSMYLCFITASNIVGNTSLEAIVYTTDVQSSIITGSDHQMNVTCLFAEGTLAKGCVVFLEKSVYQMISRVNGTAKGVIRTEFSVDCYNISVVDWEEDGSIGSVVVPSGVLLSLSKSSNMCSNDPHSKTPNDIGLLVGYSISSLIVLGLVVTMATAFAKVVCCLRQGIYVKRHQQQQHQNNQSQVSQQINSDKNDYAEPINQPTPYDNILISITKKSSAVSPYNFLQRFIHPKLHPQPSHAYEEPPDLHYNRLFKQQATPSCAQPHSTISPACYETPSAGTNV